MKTVEERFFEKVHINTTSGCWDWTGAKFRHGYGAVKIKRKMKRSHRVAFQWFRESIEVGNCVCHECDNPSCVNPHHLFQGTVLDNNRDKMHKGRHYAHFGVDHWNSKLDERSVFAIRKFLEKHPATNSQKSSSRGSVSFLSRWFGVSRCVIRRAAERSTWGHIK